VSANLFVEDSTVVTSDESGVVKTWDFATVRKKAFSTPAKGYQDTHLVGDSLIIVWCPGEFKGFHVWDVHKGQLLRKIPSFQSHGRFKISGDGSKIFELSIHYIRAVSMETEGITDSVALGMWATGNELYVRGSKVGTKYKRGWGWDFGGMEVSSYQEFPDRPKLDLVDLPRADGEKSRWIKDTVTNRLVFRLPEGYMMKPDTEMSWDGRYLLVWVRSGEVMVIDFDSVCSR
jgi:hypothetical protein